MPEPAPRARVYWDDDATLTLGSLVSETETKASGRVQVISLAAFRETVGELWDRYKDKIILIAETSIARRIGRGNTFIAVDDDSWLLLFARSAEDQAQERADAIAAAIGEKLMGARFALEEIPLPEAQRLGLANILNDDGTINLDAMRAEVARIKAASRAYAAATPAKSHARRAKEGSLKDDRIPPKAPRIVARAKPMPAAPVPAPAPEAPSQIAGLILRYRPAWSAETQSINSVHFRAYTDQGASVLDDESVNLSSTTALDLVRVGLGAFAESRKADRPFLFTLPFPVGAFSAQALGEARELIAAVPRDDRLGFLRLDFKRLPRATPDKLVALRELFRSHVQGLAFPINPFAGMDAMLALDHVSYTADVAREAKASDGEMFEALLLLKNRAGPRAVAVTGLRKRGHLAKAVAAGVAEVSGPALMDETKHMPDRIQRLSRESLMTVM